MADFISDIAKFMRRGGQEVPDTPVEKENGFSSIFPFQDRMLSEVRETNSGIWNAASNQGDYEDALAETVDGFLDVAYVAFTASLRLIGEDKTRQCWEAICEANLSKVDGSLGPVKIDPASGKILKPEGWTAPDIRGIITS